MVTLKNKDLLRSGSFVDGSWYRGSALAVVNPADGQTVTSLDDSGALEAVRAVESAKRAFDTWSRTTANERSEILKRWCALLLENIEDLAKLLTTEQGKPLCEARAEIRYGASYIEWFAEQAKRMDGAVIPATNAGQRILALKCPVGVVACITPWNFPMAMLARKMAPALAAGCTVVAKPASETPLSALALVYLGLQAGLPSGVINTIVSTKSSEVGKVFCQHPDVRKLSFTGSTAVGKVLLSQCSPSVKRTSMELGGNAPFIVFEDADIDEAVKGCMAAKFRNAGQTCVSVNRIFVHHSCIDEFTEKLKNAVSQLTLADGIVSGSDIGPLIHERAAAKVAELVHQAEQAGAKVFVAEHHRNLPTAAYFPPTVIESATADMDIFSAEIFGPVAAIYVFSDEDEVVSLANSTPYGLAGYFYSRDLARVWRVSSSLEVGMVGVNDTAISNEAAPFGGVKESGFGREGSQQGLEDYLETKYVLMGGLL